MIPKEDQANKTKANDKDLAYFINIKNHTINEYEAMKSYFFVEVKQFKNQLSNKTDSISKSSILERLIIHF